MAEYFSPVIYDESTKTYQPAPSGKQIDPAHIKIASGSENILKNSSADGLSVKLGEFVSSSSDNVLEVRDGKLFVEDKTTAPAPSETAGNALRLGNDGKLYVSGEDLNSTARDNIIDVDSNKKLTLTVDSFAEDMAGAVLSTQADNVLKRGTDHKIYTTSSEFVSTDTGNMLTVGTDKKLAVMKADLVAALADEELVDVVSTDADNLIIYGSDRGALLKATDVVAPTTDNLLKIVEGKLAVKPDAITDAVQDAGLVSTDTGNILRRGSDRGAYLDADSVLSNDTANILSVGSDNRVMLTANAVATQVKSLTLSAQSGNYARLGNDGGIYVDGNDILSNGDDNILKIDPTDGKVCLTIEYISDALKNSIDWTPVSSDAKNLIYRGSDGGSYVSGPDLISRNAANLLVVGTDNKLLITTEGIAEAINSPDPANLLKIGAENKLIIKATEIITAALSPNPGNALTTDTNGLLFISNPVSEDANNLIQVGLDDKAYLGVGDLISSEDFNAITVDSSGKLYVQDKSPVSTDTRNLIYKGSDKQAYLTGEDLISRNDGNMLTVGTDDKLLFHANTLVAMAISGQTNNALKRGADNKLFVEDLSTKSAQDLNLLSESTSNVLGYDAAGNILLGISTDNHNALVLGSDGKLFVNGGNSARDFAILSTDRSNILSYAADDGVILAISPEADNILKLDEDGKIYVPRPPDASSMTPQELGILSTDGRNMLKYDAEGKVIFTNDLGTM